MNSSRDWPEDFEHGNYQNKCVFCKQFFNGHKQRCVCKTCQAEREAAQIARQERQLWNAEVNRRKAERKVK
jgi:hypothetical protein